MWYSFFHLGILVSLVDGRSGAHLSCVLVVGRALEIEECTELWVSLQLVFFVVMDYGTNRWIVERRGMSSSM